VMACAVGRRLVVFCQVSAVLWCWVVRQLVICDRAFARILHASRGRVICSAGPSCSDLRQCGGSRPARVGVSRL
jgi:hypothetical protein